MKMLFTALLLGLLPLLSFAHSSVDAKEIIDRINGNESVSYQNATISGDVDFTRLKNRKLRRDWGQHGSDGENKNYISTVEVPIRFVNCTFTDDVLAYYHLENKEETYNADFTEDVVFESCTFRGKSAFKYSKFDRKASFKDSRFREEALFKYSQFITQPNFEGTTFEEEANFKYAHFNDGVNFSDASFAKRADFKYTQFPSGTNFRNAAFSGFADFKYAQFSGEVELDGIAFNGSEDFKYTKVNGKSFSTYLPKNK